jgi:chromosomal replication initiation ATPase DnaA
MPHPPAFWDGVLRRLGVEIPAFTLDAWVRPLDVEEHPEGLRLLCPTPFHKERVRDRFLARITRYVAEEAGKPLDIELAVGAHPARRADGRGRARRSGAFRRAAREPGRDRLQLRQLRGRPVQCPRP